MTGSSTGYNTGVQFSYHTNSLGASDAKGQTASYRIDLLKKAFQPGTLALFGNRVSKSGAQARERHYDSRQRVPLPRGPMGFTPVGFAPCRRRHAGNRLAGFARLERGAHRGRLERGGRDLLCRTDYPAGAVLLAVCGGCSCQPGKRPCATSPALAAGKRDWSWRRIPPRPNVPAWSEAASCAGGSVRAFVPERS